MTNKSVIARMNPLPNNPPPNPLRKGGGISIVIARLMKSSRGVSSDSVSQSECVTNAQARSKIHKKQMNSYFFYFSHQYLLWIASSCFALPRNDNVACHTEQSEVSQNKVYQNLNRDSSPTAQNDNVSQ